ALRLSLMMSVAFRKTDGRAMPTETTAIPRVRSWRRVSMAVSFLRELVLRHGCDQVHEATDAFVHKPLIESQAAVGRVALQVVPQDLPACRGNVPIDQKIEEVVEN